MLVDHIAYHTETIPVINMRKDHSVPDQKNPDSGTKSSTSEETAGEAPKLLDEEDRLEAKKTEVAEKHEAASTKVN